MPGPGNSDRREHFASAAYIVRLILCNTGTMEGDAYWESVGRRLLDFAQGAFPSSLRVAMGTNIDKLKYVRQLVQELLLPLGPGDDEEFWTEVANKINYYIRMAEASRSPSQFYTSMTTQGFGGGSIGRSVLGSNRRREAVSGERELKDDELEFEE